MLNRSGNSERALTPRRRPAAGTLRAGRRGAGPAEPPAPRSRRRRGRGRRRDGRRAPRIRCGRARPAPGPHAPRRPTCIGHSRNFSLPGRAKSRETASWPSARMLTPNTPESRKPACVADSTSTDTSTSGGCRLTEQNALTVSPSGSPLRVAGGDDGDSARELGERLTEPRRRRRGRWRSVKRPPPVLRTAAGPGSPARPGSPRAGQEAQEHEPFQQHEGDELRLVAGRPPVPVEHGPHGRGPPPPPRS